MSREAAIEAVVEGLAGPGYARVRGLFDEGLLRDLRFAAETARVEGTLVEASIGRGASRHRDDSLRGDSTRWIDPAHASTCESAWLACMEELRLALNRELALGAFSVEGHYAMYPAGARYARHSDRHAGSDARVVSTVLYLNDDWGAHDGGALRLYLDDDAVRGARGREPGQAVHGRHVDFAPEGGVFVAFLADRFEHEVLPATRERWSITAWMRRRG